MIPKVVTSFIAATMLFSAAIWAQPVAAQEGTNLQNQPGAGEVAPAEGLLNSLLNEMTLVWLQDESYGYIQTSCLGNGLNNIQAMAEGPMVIIPNAGDLSLAGSNVAIKLHPDGQISFIPRTQGQLMRVPVDVGNKVAGQETLSLSFEEARQLIADGQLIWTAGNQGPFGNGHGLPGHIAACDPQFDEEVWDNFDDSDEEELDEGQVS
jgi:hypothetical protein